MPRRQQTRFELDIIRDHSEAREDGRNFTVHWETDDRSYNCFAHAVNKSTEFITPTSMTRLNEIYNSSGYFLLTNNEPVLTHDVEVYASGNTPLHAHKITNPTTGECESKMGHGPVISHPRTMLQSPKRHRPNHYKFGTVVARYRYDYSQYESWYASLFTETTSGRTIKRKDAVATTSGSIIAKKDMEQTRSGRIFKKPSKYGFTSGAYSKDRDTYAGGATSITQGMTDIPLGAVTIIPEWAVAGIPEGVATSTPEGAATNTYTAIPRRTMGTINDDYTESSSKC